MTGFLINVQGDKRVILALVEAVMKSVKMLVVVKERGIEPVQATE